jgi:hypothetical protein
MNFASKDNFYEALGMEWLYSAIAYINTRPQYMRFLLHRLGQTVTSVDNGAGDSNDFTAFLLPAVTLNYVWHINIYITDMTISMIPNINVPWIPLKSKMHDNKARDTADVQGIVIDGDAVPSDESLDQSGINNSWWYWYCRSCW